MTMAFTTVTGALVPIFALIGLGYGLRRGGFPEKTFWPRLEQLVYYVLFPALLIEKLAVADTGGGNLGGLLVATILAITAMFLLLLAIHRLFPVDGPGFTSVIQGGIRFNTYLGLAAAIGVYGQEGGALAAMVMAFMIPVVNLYCVGALTVYAGGRTSLAAIAGGLARNPLILGCVVGLGLNRSGIGLPLGLDGVLEITGRAALPLGLMTVGAGLQLRTAWGRGAVLAGTSVLKLAIMPAFAFGAAWLIVLPPLETRILVLFSALPTATSAYILARQMGGDATLVATILTVQTLLSLITLPLLLTLLGPG